MSDEHPREALYDTQPMLRILDAYFLDCIGQLDEATAQALERSAPQLAEALGGGPTWQEVVEHALRLDPATREAVAQAYVEQDGQVEAETFAYACTDDLVGEPDQPDGAPGDRADGQPDGQPGERPDAAAGERPPLETVASQATGSPLRGTAAAPLRPAVEAIVRGFEDYAEHWRDGYAQNWGGWGVFTLRAQEFDQESGEGYVLEAPDYFTDPGTSTSDLTAAVMATAGISSVVAAAGVDPVSTAYDDAVVCALGWEHEALLTVSRTADPDGGDSGIFVGPFHHDHDQDNPWTREDVESRHAWDVFRHRPAVARGFGLPVGITAIVEGETIRMVVRDSDREVLAEGPL